MCYTIFLSGLEVADCKVHLDPDQIGEMEHYLQGELCDDTDTGTEYQEYFQYLLSSLSLQFPVNVAGAFELFQHLTKYAAS